MRRFAWLVAAATALIASSAQAADYIKIQLIGHGQLYQGVSNQYPFPPVIDRDFTLTFAIRATPGNKGDFLPYDGGDGTSYGYVGLTGYVFTTALKNGVVTTRETNPDYGDYDNSTVTFSAPDAQSFSDLRTGVTNGQLLYSHSVYEGFYEFEGAVSRVFVSPTTAFEGLSIATAPEPTAWAMMVLGFGLVGAGLRRSRKVPSFVNAI